MRFQKIKYNGEQVELRWVTKKPNLDEESHRLTSFQRPDVDLQKAMRAFVPLVFTLLELPQSYDQAFLVRGLTIIEEESDGRLGLVITCQKKLEHANAPAIINTPYMREAVGADRGPGFFLPGTMAAIEDAELAAARFVKGERFQKDLFTSSTSSRGRREDKP
jgi:hypothetical protein